MSFRIRIKDKVVIGVVCIILGIFLSIQFKVVQSDFLGGVMPNQRSVELVSELQKVKEDKVLIQTELDNFQNKLSEIEEMTSQDNSLIKNLKDELEYHKIVGGFTAVRGEGLLITIDVPRTESNVPYDNDWIYDFRIILQMLNTLKVSGVEAVSINDQRLIATSEIRNDESVVKINSIPIQPPFEIKVIGEKNSLESALKKFLSDQLLGYNYVLSYKNVDEVEIPKYNDVVSYELATPAKFD